MRIEATNDIRNTAHAVCEKDIRNTARQRDRLKDIRNTAREHFSINSYSIMFYYGKAFVAYYEDYARRNNCYELRMGTNVINIRARHMYTSLGYDEVGVVDCVFNGIPGVKLVCL